ncbi:MAG: DsrE family protein [Tissierella sp.]|uniref:DsrE family protein n=1 Tax=Tissierella sp. TaxID=41274 RepID=UPI003F999274
MYKVIFHLDDEGRVGVVYRGIMNLLHDMETEGEEVEVELLANSSGVKPFMKDKEENKEAIDLLLEKGVKIALCNNTLRVLYLTKKDFVHEATIVKSGVGELTRKQHEGWGYIKP